MITKPQLSPAVIFAISPPLPFGAEGWNQIGVNSMERNINGGNNLGRPESALRWHSGNGDHQALRLGASCFI